MIKIILLTIITILLVGCGNSEEQSVVEETGEILNDYVENMDVSVQSARDVQELMNKNQEELKDNLKDLY